MNTAQIKIYDILRNELKLSEDKALHFTEAVDDVLNNSIKQNTADYKSAVKEDILQLGIRLKDKISNQFKWVIGIFVTLALMIIGLYIKR